ncbi:GAF domain-containing protein [Hyalangium versicolor]|uniref:GAF domain-containing protein n=1 Tax=Hyalangium versicolor TaxID=2861190 RepID=UPI001CCFDC08|nr:GAF domain-containing protein [Hyalangium versicolor]
MAWGMIVEPDTAWSSKFQGVLAELGLEPVVVPDGKSAKATLLGRPEAPTVVLTELSLAGIDGFELIREIRKRSPFARIIVISAFVKMRNAALEQKDLLGIQEVLAKSVSVESHRRTLYRALGRKLPEAPASTASPFEPSAPIPQLPPLDESATATVREQGRLTKLASLNLVDEGPADETLQRLVRETAQAFDVPIALLSLVLEKRQWFKAYVGIGGQVLQDRGTEREVALCAHVVEADQPTPLVVPDATIHPVFSSNRLVREGLFRSYAGAPLITREGTVLGTLCILDQKPLGISAEQVDTLVALARRVAGELELRLQLRKSQASLHAERSAHAGQRLRADILAAALNSFEDAVMILDHRRVILFANEYMSWLADRSVDELIGMQRDAFIRAFATRFKDPLDFVRRVRVMAEGPYVGREDFELQMVPRRVVRWTSKPVPFADGTFGQITFYRDVTEEKL